VDLEVEIFLGFGPVNDVAGFRGEYRAVENINVISDSEATFTSPRNVDFDNTQYLDIVMQLDGSAVWTRAERSFMYPPGPNASLLRPLRGSVHGGTPVRVFGEHFGSDESTGSAAPSLCEFTDTITGESFFGKPLGVEGNGTIFVCESPANLGGDGKQVSKYDVTITIDEESTTVHGMFETISSPVLESTSSDASYTTATREERVVTLTGANFGPTTVSGNGPSISVMITPEAPFVVGQNPNPELCENVNVLSDKILTCVVPQGLGRSFLAVKIDNQETAKHLSYDRFDEAGTYAIASKSYEILEPHHYFNVMGEIATLGFQLQRVHGGKYPGPVEVEVVFLPGSEGDLDAEGIPILPANLEQFQEGPIKRVLSSGIADFVLNVTAAQAFPETHRYGRESDRRVVIRIASIKSLYGPSKESTQGESKVDIRALCQGVSEGCRTVIESEGVRYERTDGKCLRTALGECLLIHEPVEVEGSRRRRRESGVAIDMPLDA
jgi:hypothetical protein